jgi:hypothetical protein
MLALLSLVHELKLALTAETFDAPTLDAALADAVSVAEQYALEHGMLFGDVQRFPTARPSEKRISVQEALKALAQPWQMGRDQVEIWYGSDAREDAAVARVRTCFADHGGLKFLTSGKAVTIWLRSTDKIRQLRAAGARELFAARNMAHLWERILAAHATFGEDTQASERDEFVADDVEAPIDLRAELHASLREYVLKVCASVSRKDPATHARAQRLMAPLQQALATADSARAERNKQRAAQPRAANKPRKAPPPTQPEVSAAEPAANTQQSQDLRATGS